MRENIDKMAFYRATGRFGEEYARSYYESIGYEVYDGTITLVAGGGIRRPDLAIRKMGSDVWQYVEVKTGQSPLVKRQILRDRAIQTNGYFGITGPLRGIREPTNVQLLRLNFIPGT
jgi:hypothetical protein